jgi:hypothetical protein
MSFSFFHFGCWNVDGCIPQSSNTKQIVEHIKSQIMKYKFGIIAGDNIYPTKQKTAKSEKSKKDKEGKKSKEGKEDKIKTFDQAILFEGIKCIKSIGIPIYTVLGNHDVEYADIIKNYSSWILSPLEQNQTKNIGMYATEPAVSVPPDTASASAVIASVANAPIQIPIQKELAYMEQLPESVKCEHMAYQLSPSRTNDNMYTFQYNNSFFIAIDTNILGVVSSENNALKEIIARIDSEYHDRHTDPVKMEQYNALQKHIEDYKNFQFNSGEKHEEIQTYISQLGKPVTKRDMCYSILDIKSYININQVGNFLTQAFREAIKYEYIFIVGHDPIFSHKKKKDKTTCVTSYYRDSRPMFDFLFDIANLTNISQKNIYYLCADTHNFQDINLQITHNEKIYNIREIVSGTGGAEPDSIPVCKPIEQQIILPLDKMLVKTNNVQDCYGYTDITCTVGSEPIITYIRVSTDENVPEPFNSFTEAQKILCGGNHNLTKKYVTNKIMYSKLHNQLGL